MCEIVFRICIMFLLLKFTRTHTPQYLFLPQPKICMSL